MRLFVYADLEFVYFELFQSAHSSILVRFKLLLCYVTYHMRSGSSVIPRYNILSSAASHINNEPCYFVSSRSVIWNFACSLKKVSLHFT